MTELLRELEAVARQIRKGDDWNAMLEGYALLRTHHAEIAEALKLAKWYRGLRDSDPDNGEPYIARERQDSWGNWKAEWLGGLDADRAIDAMHNSAREVGE